MKIKFLIFLFAVIAAFYFTDFFIDISDENKQEDIPMPSRISDKCGGRALAVSPWVSSFKKFKFPSMTKNIVLMGDSSTYAIPMEKKQFMFCKVRTRHCGTLQDYLSDELTRISGHQTDVYGLVKFHLTAIETLIWGALFLKDHKPDLFVLGLPPHYFTLESNMQSNFIDLLREDESAIPYLLESVKYEADKLGFNEVYKKFKKILKKNGLNVDPIKKAIQKQETKPSVIKAEVAVQKQTASSRWMSDPAGILEEQSHILIANIWERFSLRLEGKKQMFYLFRNLKAYFNHLLRGGKTKVPQPEQITEVFYENQKLIRILMNLAMNSGAKSYVYLTPMRADYPEYYNQDAYFNYKKYLEDLKTASNGRFGYIDATQFVPLEYFGYFCFAPDFRHFNFFGQKVLAEKLAPEIVSYLYDKDLR